MSALYLAGLLVGIAGMLTLDLRYRLFFGADARRATVVLLVGVLGFLAWDLAGIRLGIFFEGNHSLLTGVQLAPQLPLEEVFFLVLLCMTTMNAFAAAGRLLSSRAGRAAPRRPDATG